MADRYAEEIVNPGDRASAFAHQMGVESFGNSSAIHVIPHQPGNFRGPVGFTWRKHVLEQMLKNGVHNDTASDDEWTMLEAVENDGAGGKPQFFTLVGTPDVFSGLGWEIITMCADDFARSGRFPVVIDNEVNVRGITDENFHLFEAMMSGYGEALKQARLVNVTGEVAIMQHSVTAFCDTGSAEQLVLTWGASCVGLAHKDRLIDPSRIRPGMPIVGFKDPGYRCNGGTFFTNLILELCRDRGMTDMRLIAKDVEAIETARRLCVPSKSYAGLVSRLVGWNPDASLTTPLAEIYGIAHITGGGVWGKFGELLPEGVGANLDNMPNPAQILLKAQRSASYTSNPLSDLNAYGTLHGGCGMLLVCNPDSVGTIVSAAATAGVSAQRVGETMASVEGEIVIDSLFNEGCERHGGLRLSSLELEG
jgi:phosphoribosylformylglycinamidine cyclo-ligase